MAATYVPHQYFAHEVTILIVLSIIVLFGLLLLIIDNADLQRSALNESLLNIGIYPYAFEYTILLHTIRQIYFLTKASHLAHPLYLPLMLKH